MIVTKHANKRIKERCGLNSKSTERLSNKILSEGLKHSECTGKLKRWVDGLYLNGCSANNVRIYGDKAYLFNGDVLITVLQVPNELLKTANILQSKKRGRENASNDSDGKRDVQ